MESSLSQLFIVYSAFILPLSNRQHSYDNEHHPYSTVLCSDSHAVTEQCEYPALYHITYLQYQKFLKVQSLCEPTPLLICLSGSSLVDKSTPKLSRKLYSAPHMRYEPTQYFRIVCQIKGVTCFVERLLTNGKEQDKNRILLEKLRSYGFHICLCFSCA